MKRLPDAVTSGGPQYTSNTQRPSPLRPPARPLRFRRAVAVTVASPAAPTPLKPCRASGTRREHSISLSFISSQFKMASPGLKPGVPVILRELEPSSEMFKQGASLRVTGSLQSYDVDSATVVIQDGSVSLKVDTQHLRDVSFRMNSTYHFIGELQIREDNDAILLARIGRNVDGLDLNLYQQAILIRRQHEAMLLSSRTRTRRA